MWIHEGWATYLECLYVEYMYGRADALKYVNAYKAKVRNREPVIAERHGFPLSGPEALSGANPGVVVVMSRGFAGEIVAEAKSLAPGAEVVVFTELLGRARLRLAA